MKHELFSRPWFVALAIAGVCARGTVVRGQNIHKSSVTSPMVIPNDTTETIREQIGVSTDDARRNSISKDADTSHRNNNQNGGDSDGGPIHDTARNVREVATPFIVGGDESEPGEFPYFVDAGGCGGSLIAPTVVLTAAHCRPRAMTGKNVTVGSSRRNTLSNGNSFQQAESIRVLDGASHPMFKVNGYLNNDFGLLLLEKPYDYAMNSNNKIQLVLNKDHNIPRSGDMLDAIGMGAKVFGGSGGTELRDVSVPATSNPECREIYQTLTDRMLCAGEVDGGKDACQGDSGGPLLKRDGNIHIQVGIVSFGRNCAKFPGVYARISRGYNWIQKQVCEKWQVPSPEICGPDQATISEVNKCSDDLNFRYQGDSQKGCDWVGIRSKHRCNLKIGGGIKRRTRKYCRKACRKC